MMKGKNLLGVRVSRFDKTEKECGGIWVGPHRHPLPPRRPKTNLCSFVTLARKRKAKQEKKKRKATETEAPTLNTKAGLGPTRN